MKWAPLMAIGLLAFAGGRLLSPPVEPGVTANQPGAGPPVIDSLSPVAGTSSPQDGHALCIHQDVFPVARFVDNYYDGVGQHYHGWRPPAGPPFYVQCPADGAE